MSEITPLTVGSVRPGIIFQPRDGMTEFIKDPKGRIFQVISIEHGKRRIVGKIRSDLSLNTRVRVRARAFIGYEIEPIS
jgi:hypothetical protein